MRFMIGYQVGFSTFLSRYSWLGFPKAIGVSFSLLFTLESSGNRSHASYE